jgi:hypothetical protein
MEKAKLLQYSFLEKLAVLYKNNNGSNECLYLIEDCLDSLKEINQLYIEANMDGSYDIEEDDLQSLINDEKDINTYFNKFIKSI